MLRYSLSRNQHNVFQWSSDLEMDSKVKMQM